MKDFPTKLTPNNLEKFKHYRTQRNICKLKQFIYEFMLSNDFNIGRSTVTTCDINTPKLLLNEECLKADIVIVAVGKPNLVTADMIKEGAVVIDVGINKLDNGKLVGDCDFDEIVKKARITPVPGGVGPMTISGLILNTLEAWKMKNFINK